MPKEIERKFLVKEFPEELKHSAECQPIEQGYLALEKDGKEVRLRKKGKQYLLTVKTAGSLLREEYETALSRSQFKTLWEATRGRRLSKERYTFELDSYTIEVDRFAPPLHGLILAEIEFETEQAAHDFQAYDWMYKDVTEIVSFKNRELIRFDSFQQLMAAAC